MHFLRELQEMKIWEEYNMMKCRSCDKNIYGGKAQTCSEACREALNKAARDKVNSRLSDKAKAMLATREPWKC